MNQMTRVKGKIAKYLYVTPLLILLAFLYIYPIIRTVVLSFTDASFGSSGSVFVGLDNYRALFSDPAFWTSLKNNAVWGVGNLVLQMVLAFAVAVLLNQKFRGVGAVRTIVLLPWIIPTAAIACVIRWILLPNVGIVNEILVGSGLVKEAVNFLGTENAMKTLILLNSWKAVPIGVLLILSALQTIPAELYESAQVDGASSLQSFFHITYPIISKMLWFTSFLIFVWGFNSFDVIWMVTQGGPDIATQTLPVMVYRYAFKMMNVGLSSTVAVVIAVILILLGVIYFAVMAKGGQPDE